MKAREAFGFAGFVVLPPRRGLRASWQELEPRQRSVFTTRKVDLSWATSSSSSIESSPPTMNDRFAGLLEGCGLPDPRAFVRRVRDRLRRHVPLDQFETAVWEA